MSIAEVFYKISFSFMMCGDMGLGEGYHRNETFPYVISIYDKLSFLGTLVLVTLCDACFSVNTKESHLEIWESQSRRYHHHNSLGMTDCGMFSGLMIDVRGPIREGSAHCGWY